MRPDQHKEARRALSSAKWHRGTATGPLVLGNYVGPIYGSYLVQAYCHRHGGSVN